MALPCNRCNHAILDHEMVIDNQVHLGGPYAPEPVYWICPTEAE